MSQHASIAAPLLALLIAGCGADLARVSPDEQELLVVPPAAAAAGTVQAPGDVSYTSAGAAPRAEAGAIASMRDVEAEWVVLLSRGSGSELAYVRVDGGVTYRALPPELANSTLLLADGVDLILDGSSGSLVRLLDAVNTQRLGIPVGAGTARVSAPGEVTAPDETAVGRYDLATGELLESSRDLDRCWMATGHSANGVLSLDWFTSELVRFEAGSVEPISVGLAYSWWSYAETADGTLWTMSGPSADLKLTARRQDGTHVWATVDSVVALHPFGDDAVLALLDTGSASRDSRLVLYSADGDEEVIASFPGAVVYDVVVAGR